MRNICYREFNSNRPFGVELEVSPDIYPKAIGDILETYSHRPVKISTWKQTLNNRYWHVKTDSTCGYLGNGLDFGYEIASYKASGYVDICHIAGIAERLSEHGISVNDNCGFHIHMDLSDF